MIVIPMAGSSARFFSAGFHRPKYELVCHGRTLFDWAVSSFIKYFATEHFVFISRRDFAAQKFIAGECARLGIKSYNIIELDGVTRGQAETVSRGTAPFRSDFGQDSITVFNIDTVRFDYSFDQASLGSDGMLEVFRGAGSNWSFVKLDPENDSRVAEVTEKEPISDFCSTGLYWFRSLEQFDSAFQRAISSKSYMERWRELYVAPLYNFLIQDGADVKIQLIDPEEVRFVGTPAEYAAFASAAVPGKIQTRL